MVAAQSTPKLTFSTLPTGAKAFILVALLALLFGAYYAVFHLGLEGEMDTARRSHDKLISELKEVQLRQQNYLRLREELAGREALERQIMRVLPQKAEIPAFLDDLNRLAELSGLRMGNVVPQPESPDQFFVKVPVSLKIEGKYHQLAKFFYNISRLERAINMENIGIGQPRDEGDEVLLSVDVLATTFRRRAEEGQP